MHHSLIQFSLILILENLNFNKNTEVIKVAYFITTKYEHEQETNTKGEIIQKVKKQ